MFETDRFARELTDAVATQVRDLGFGDFDRSVTKTLRRLAMENESVLMERELRKAVGERRGLRHALRSARELTKDAARYAAKAGRDKIKAEDFNAAYSAKFCQFWPFCKR